VLQWTVANTNHTENDVLAAQSKCPLELTIREFIKYGCFRAGHRLQMRNLLDAIETRSLSMKNFSVFALFAQTLWQIGKLNEDTSGFNHNVDESKFFYPESHTDFSDSNFILKLHEYLSKLISLSSKCWNDHIIMLNIITIIARAIALAPNFESRQLMANLMLKCRLVIQDWINKVIDVINYSSFTDKLKESLFEISCFNILTFFIDKKYLKLVFNNYDHIFQWFNSMSCLYENKIYNNLDFFKRNLYRQVLICILENEDHIFNLINTNKNILTDFVNSRWPDSSEGYINEWIQYECSKQWYQADFIRNLDGVKLKLQLSIYGDFLVHGFPVGKLPESIYNHCDFKAFFDNKNFDVTTSCNGVGTYVTRKNDKMESSDISYSFFQYNSGLIVKEKKNCFYESHKKNCNELKNKTQEFLYLKKSHFNSLFPNNLINSYSHWLNCDENVIEFRENKYSDYLANKTVYFKLKLNENLVHDCIMDRYLIDIQSQTFKEFYNKIAHYLEESGFIHILRKMNSF
jgi:hypothetical protein